SSCTSCSTGASCWTAAWSSSSAWSARATITSGGSSARARPAPSRPVTAVAEDGRAGRAPVPSSAGAGPAAANGAAGARAGATDASARAKSGAHRQAALYHALARRGAADGRSLAELREAALEAAAAAELPVWRRSGFWTTTLQGLKLEQLDAGAQPSRPGALPEVVARTLPERTRA